MAAPLRHTGTVAARGDLAQARALPTLRALLIEDSANDADLIEYALHREARCVAVERVETREGLAAALDRGGWDVIISDYHLPQFSGREALKMVRLNNPEVPFILVSGAISPEVAAKALRNGASDCVMKDALDRLSRAVARVLQELHERRQNRTAQRSLEASEERYRRLVEDGSDGLYVVQPNGRFTLVNPRFCEMTGYGEEELLRLAMADTYPEADREGVPSWLTALSKVQVRTFERLLRRADGQCVPVEVSVRYLESGAIQGVVRDVHERDLGLAAIAENESRFRQLAENIRDVIFLIDANYVRTHYVSQAFEAVFGMDRAKAYANPLIWAEVIHPDDRAAFDADFQRRVSAGSFDDTCRIVRPDGTVRWIHARGFPISDAAGKLVRIAGIVEDITGRREAEERIRRLNRVYAVLSGINSTIVRVDNRADLFRESCRIAVDAGRFPFVWLGWVNREAQTVRPVASSGAHRQILDLLQVRFDFSDGSPAARGLMGEAIRQRKPAVANDTDSDPRVISKLHRHHGVRSVAVLPLLVGGEPVAVLGLHAAEAGFFDAEEMKLLTELAGDIAFAIDHIEKAEKLAYLSHHDALTGLPNRTLFHERLEQQVHHAAQSGSSLAVTILDIDRFKSINDSLGRQAGDQLLKQFAERLTGNANDPARFARVGADHFGVIVPDPPSPEHIGRRVAQRLRDCFDTPFQVGDVELRMSAKVGIALFPADGRDADALFTNAESALKNAKATGESYLFFEPAMTARIAEKLRLENRLRDALQREEFVLHYQPKVNLETGRIQGVEALIRWASPEHGLVAPGKFIPLMEETGLILDAGAWALRQAAADHRRWREQGLDAPRVAVNVSSIQLRRQNFVETVREAVLAGDSAGGIDIEITESVIMDDLKGNVEKLEALRALGVNVAIDDFGTGYSSLAYLAKLPVQALKIDRSFIAAMSDDSDAMTLVSTIVSLAHSFRLKVVAEGVETTDQARFLRLLQCDQMQGYLVSRPIPFDQMTELLASGRRFADFKI